MNIFFLMSLAAGFVLIITVLVVIRSKTGNKYEIKNSDIVLALLVIVLIMFASGKNESFEFGDLKVKSAIVEASNKEITEQITTLEGIPFHDIQTFSKGAVSNIPQLIKNKTEALEFHFGHGGYYGPAIREYFEALSRQSLLHFIIVNNADRKFFGMYTAADLLGYFSTSQSGDAYQDFANWLNRQDTASLSNLPGFVSATEALSAGANKAEALNAMEIGNLNVLPVLDKDQKFEGVVDRSRLTASLILDVTKQLSQTNGKK